MHNSEYDIWCYECGDIAQANEADFVQAEYVDSSSAEWLVGQFSSVHSRSCTAGQTGHQPCCLPELPRHQD